MGTLKRCGRIWIAGLCLTLLVGSVQGATVTARAALSANSVYVGEPFVLQIQISGSENPERPDLSKLDGFSAVFTRGIPSSSHVTQIIDGRVYQNKQLGYKLNYELRATRDGRLVIPPIEVKVDGQTVRTQRLLVQAQNPSETENFKLRLSLSKEQAYVGEQVVLEAVFYYSSSGEIDGSRGLDLSIPIESSDAFSVYDLDRGQDGKRESLEGKSFNTSRVRKVIVPKQAGSFPVDPATLSFRGADGYEMVRDSFRGTVRRPKYRQYAIPSNRLPFTVLPLPKEGQPANFDGHIGEFALSVQASSSEVKVGDPITLNIALSGPSFLDSVELPDLNKQESLTRDFKVPSEIEEGTVNGAFKVFTQTVRALRDDVTAIPPIELVYFDTAKGAYGVARSHPIPLVVRPTKTVTAGDAEGLGPLGAAQTEVQALLQGIAHNYSGSEALRKQVLGFSGLASPGRLALLVGPPLAYGILFVVVAGARRRHANPESMRARKALGGFNRHVTQASTPEELLAVLTRYLGDKLALTPDALTFGDVRDCLSERGVSEESLAETKTLFTAGEASRFAGGTGEDEVGQLRERAITLVKELEKSLR